MSPEQEITVKVPAMPPAEMDALVSELAPLLKKLTAKVEAGELEPPVVVVVSDSRYPMLPAPEEVRAECPSVVFYDRDEGTAKLIERRAR